VNNIAWLLRRLPLFVIPGDGHYTLQPIAAEDVAQLSVEAASTDEPRAFDAAGPDVYTFEELVRLVRAAVRSRARIAHAPVRAAHVLGAVVGLVLRDTLITRPELDGLMTNLLTSYGPPTGTRRFGDWLRANAETLGSSYTSETKRNWS
jgi:NADH dehydrogenase